MGIAIIQDFCAEFDYPNVVCEALQNAYAQTAANAEATSLLQENMQLLWKDQFGEMGEELIRLDKIAEIIFTTDINKFFSIFIFLLQLQISRAQECFSAQAHTFLKL